MPRRTRLTPAELYLRPPVPEFEDRPFSGPAAPSWPCSFADGGLLPMPPVQAASAIAAASPREIAACRIVSLADYRQSRRTAAR